MKFSDKKIEAVRMIEMICLILSMGAVFLQIWVLSSALESYFEGRYDDLSASLILSGVAFLLCALTAWTTKINFMKGIQEGRTPTYTPFSLFKNKRNQPSNKK